MSQCSSHKKIPVIIPAGLDYVEFNGLACLRFDYRLPSPHKVPRGGDLYTALTLEQAKDTVTFLQNYIQHTESALPSSPDGVH